MPEPTTWTIHLARRRPGRTAGALLAMLFTLFFLRTLGADWILLTLALLFFLVAIAEFLLPMHYTFDAEGAHIRVAGSHRVLSWQRIRRVYVYQHVIILSPLASRGLLESYRGMQVRSTDVAATLAQLLIWLDAGGNSPEIIEE